MRCFAFWALNPDGSGLSQLTQPAAYFRAGPIAPRGGHAAFVTSEDAQGLRGLNLKLITLPGGEVREVAALTTAATEPGPDALPGDPAYDVNFVVGQSAWSPDGRRLAFIGAQDGPSTNVLELSGEGYMEWVNP